MARKARLVVPRHPHHLTHRGNRRQCVFFADDDCCAYLRLVGEACGVARTAMIAYCL